MRQKSSLQPWFSHQHHFCDIQGRSSCHYPCRWLNGDSQHFERTLLKFACRYHSIWTPQAGISLWFTKQMVELGSSIRKFDLWEWSFEWSPNHIFLNIIATTVANSTKTDHTTLSPHKWRIWMADWSSQCMAGSTGYNWKPDLVLVSNMITSCNEITWLSLKVIGEYSKESFQLVSHIRRTINTKAYLVMVDQPWRQFVLGLSLANEELWVHFYDHSSGLISLPFNIHAEPDSFLYVISGLVFGICSCISFDMTIEISPPPINSCRWVIAKSPPTESGPSTTAREFQGSTPGCPGLDPHPYPHDTPTPTPQGGGHSCGCQGADPSGVDPRVWHLPLDHTVQVYNIFIIIYYTR